MGRMSSKWRKSSYSFSNGNCAEVSTWRKPAHSADQGNCVEAASWRKSAASTYNGNCVEAGHGTGQVLVRDTKNRGAGPVLTFTPQAWAAFTAALKDTPGRPERS